MTRLETIRIQVVGKPPEEWAWVEVKGRVIVADGLAVTPDPSGRKGYVVTHIPTGMSIPLTERRLLKNARAVARELAEAPVDWPLVTQNSSKEVRDAVREACCALSGSTYYGE